MKKKNLIMILLILSVFIFYGCDENKKSYLNDDYFREYKEVKVDIKNFEYSPKELKIEEGTTVIWTNYDNITHTVTSTVKEEANSRDIKSGETFKYTFYKKGEYDYYCLKHSNMKGKIIVEEDD